MAYQKQEWKDLPDTSTPITAERLNHIEDGIANCDKELFFEPSEHLTINEFYMCGISTVPFKILFQKKPKTILEIII